MSVLPFYNPKFRALDGSGNPLDGGLLYTYEAGTTTPLATYTTRAGNVANANPVVLDDNGEADVWLTPGVDYKFTLKTSAGALLWTVDNVPTPAEDDASSDAATDPGGRLSLTSGTSVTTSDVTGATSVYYVPHKSDKVPLWDGEAWTVNTIETELSQAISDTTKSPAAATGGGLYDIFVWDDAGTLRATRGPAWTAPGVRGTGAGTTELEILDGRRVNKVSISNGPAAQRGLYVGTIFSDISANQVFDSMAKRYVWNNYNRVLRPMRVLESTNSWTYGTNTYRQARNSTANQLDFVIGLSEDAVCAQLNARVQPSQGSKGNAQVAIGLDSTSTASAAGRASWPTDGTTFPTHNLGANYAGFPGIGRHYFAWMEKIDPTDFAFGETGNWYGDDGSDLTHGLTGSLMG